VMSIGPLVALILLGEVMPKLLAARLAMKWSRWSALPLMATHQTLAPLRIGFNAVIITPLARLIAPPQMPPKLTPKELESILDHSLQRGVINHEEEHLLQQVLELSQLKVRDLMTPRVDIKAFDLSHPPEELYDLARSSRYSRIPAYRGDLDHIEGIVLARQEFDDLVREHCGHGSYADDPGASALLTAVQGQGYTYVLSAGAQLRAVDVDTTAGGTRCRIVEEGARRGILAAPRHPYTQGLLRAMPAGGRHGEPLVEIPGTVPAPEDWPAGCRFTSRCPRAFEPCPDVMPGDTVLEGGQVARCHAVAADQEAGRYREADFAAGEGTR